MYYPKVNRGLSFSKAGIYTFGLILLVGFVAIASGMNSLYIFLSAGLGGFIVSGVLSEQAMKSAKISSLGSNHVNAGESFELRCRVENRSRWFNLFGIYINLVKEKPRMRLISKTWPSFMHGCIEFLPHGTTDTIILKGLGLNRKVYDEFTLVQRTFYPFGLLEKFRADTLKTSLIVSPRFDQQLYKELQKELQKKIFEQHGHTEFFGHRSYNHSDSLKVLDHKKNAGKSNDQWVVKVFHDQNPHIEADLHLEKKDAMQCKSEEEYEALLVKYRTICGVYAENQLPCKLWVDENTFFDQEKSILHVLAALPSSSTVNEEWMQTLDALKSEYSKQSSKVAA